PGARAGLGADGDRDPGGGRALLPGRGRAAAAPLARAHAGRRARLHGAGAVDGDLSRPRHHDRRARLQHGGRRPARLARPAAGGGPVVNVTVRDVYDSDVPEVTAAFVTPPGPRAAP